MGVSLRMSLREVIRCLMQSSMYFELPPWERLALAKVLLRRYFR